MFVAVTVYDVVEETTVGVPEISPVDVLKVRPVGRTGVIDHDSTAPPLTLGVSGVIAESLVNVYGLAL